MFSVYSDLFSIIVKIVSLAWTVAPVLCNIKGRTERGCRRGGGEGNMRKRRNLH